MTEEQKIKYLYEYSVAVDFDYEKTQQVCAKLEISNYISYIRKYLNTLNLTKKQLEEKVSEIKNKRSVTRKKLGRKLEQLNHVLLQHGRKSYYLWETEEDKKIVGKYVVDCCLEHGNEKGLAILAEEFKNITTFALTRLMYEYYEIIEKENPKEYQKILERRQQMVNERVHKQDFGNYYVSGSNVVLKEILCSTKLSEVIKIIEESDFDYDYLMRQVRLFSVYYEDSKSINDNLTKKLTAYKKYKDKQRNEVIEVSKQQTKDRNRDKDIQKGISLMKEFLTSSLSPYSFLSSKQVTEGKMNKYLSMVSEVDKDLCVAYMEKVEKEKKLLSQKIQEVLPYIKNGIEVNNIIRPFNIIDYYFIIKNPIEEVLAVAASILNNEDMKYLRTFIGQNTPSRQSKFASEESFEKYIMETDFVKNMKKDENGNLIPGTGQPILEETKIKVFDYLKTNQIPKNEKTYNAVLQMYLSNELPTKQLNR